MNRTARTAALTVALFAVGGGVAVATDAPPYTAVYAYGPVDPALPLGPGNSGPQALVSVTTGHIDHRKMPYPTDCDVSYQVDWVNASPEQIPATLPGAYGLGGIFVKGWHHVGEPCDVEPAPEPEPVVPPVVTPPTEPPPPVEVPSPAAPVTPATAKDLTALSSDERVQVESYAAAHGIRPEAVLVEMG